MPTYIDLEDLISFEGFLFDHTYWQQEVELLQPQLEELGYIDIKWSDGERDSFGPLTRTCQARNLDDEIVHFIYG